MEQTLVTFEIKWVEQATTPRHYALETGEETVTTVDALRAVEHFASQGKEVVFLNRVGGTTVIS